MLMGAKQVKTGLRVDDLDRSVALGSGVVPTVPTTDISAVREPWRREALQVTLGPEDVGFAVVFYGLEPDGYELVFGSKST